MDVKEVSMESDGKKWKMYKRTGGGWGGVYFLAFIGALVYYYSHLPASAGFGIYVVDFFKAVFWPAILIFKVYSILKF